MYKSYQDINISRIVIFVRAAAEIGRGHHIIPGRDPTSWLAVDQVVARGHIHPAADGLRGIHRVIPIRESAARGNTDRPACGGRGPGSGRRRGTGAGRVAWVRFGLAGVQVCGELGVVVVAFDVEGGEDGFQDRGGECVALVFCSGVDEGEGCV